MKTAKRYEIARSWKEVRWAITAFAVGAGIAVVAALFDEGPRLFLVVAIPVLVLVFSIVSEIVYQAYNYVMFHDEWVDVSENEWGIRRYSWSQGSTRVPYADVISTDWTDDVLELKFRIDPLKPRFRWPPVEYHGRTAILRFHPREPEIVGQELERRVSLSRAVVTSFERSAD